MHFFIQGAFVGFHCYSCFCQERKKEVAIACFIVVNIMLLNDSTYLANTKKTAFCS